MEAFLVAVWLLGWVGLVAVGAYFNGRNPDGDGSEIGVPLMVGWAWPVCIPFVPFVLIYNLGKRHANKDRAP